MKRKELEKVIKEEGLEKELKREVGILGAALWAMNLSEKLYDVLEEKDVNEKKVKKVINDSFKD